MSRRTGPRSRAGAAPDSALQHGEPGGPPRLDIDGHRQPAWRFHHVRREHLAEADQPLAGVLRSPHLTEHDVRHLADQEAVSDRHGLELIYDLQVLRTRTNNL